MLLSLIYAVLSVQSFAMFWSQNYHSWNRFVLWNHTISVTFEGLAGNYLVLSRIWIFLFFQGQIRSCANQIAFYISDDDDDVMKIGRCQWEAGNLCPSWWLPLTGSHLVTQRLRIEALEGRFENESESDQAQLFSGLFSSSEFLLWSTWPK